MSHRFNRTKVEQERSPKRYQRDRQTTRLKKLTGSKMNRLATKSPLARISAGKAAADLLILPMRIGNKPNKNYEPRRHALGGRLWQQGRVSRPFLRI